MNRALVVVAATLLMWAPAAAQTPEFVPVGPGAWRLQVERDAMTDHARATAVVISETRNAGLIVQCQSGARANQVYFGVEFDSTYLGFDTDPIQEVMIRFDQNPPQTMRWRYDDKLVQLTDQRRVAALVAQLRSAQHVAFRALVWNLPQYNVVDATFDVTGSAEAIEAVYAACGQAAP